MGRFFLKAGDLRVLVLAVSMQCRKKLPPPWKCRSISLFIVLHAKWKWLLEKPDFISMLLLNCKSLRTYCTIAGIHRDKSVTHTHHAFFGTEGVMPLDS